MKASHYLLILGFLSTTVGCDGWTDAAMRLAYDIEAGAGRLGGHIERRNGRAVVTDVR